MYALVPWLTYKEGSGKSVLCVVMAVKNRRPENIMVQNGSFQCTVEFVF